MQTKSQNRNVSFALRWRALTAVLAAMVLLLFLFVLTTVAQAQTYKVIYNFAGGTNGSAPFGGVTMDAAGNLYGTTYSGGYSGGECAASGCGTVFELVKQGTGWSFQLLYSFRGGWDDGALPSDVTFGPDGALYGTTFAGGPGGTSSCKLGPQRGCGTVFRLKASSSGWTETVLHGFAYIGNIRGQHDGATPVADLIFDEAGTIYGATNGGGGNGVVSGLGYGTVYKMTPSNGGWQESVIYNFGTVKMDGCEPGDGVIRDSLGNLYGTTEACGQYYYGTVYQLTPGGAGWSENILYSFQFVNDGAQPVGGLISDQAGNLYGTTWALGPNKGGTVFMLSPSADNWVFTVLYDFGGRGSSTNKLLLDAAGNLYGIWHKAGQGSVFKLTKSEGWSYSSLHDFTGGSDGGIPSANLIFDASGSIYGTAESGGVYGNGVVFEITP